MRSLIRSKIHLATVTDANIDYVGSISIDRKLIDASKLWVGEKVLVTSVTTGQRLETYVIESSSNSGKVEINGSAAHLIKPGEKVIIMGFEIVDKPIKPTVVVCNSDNSIKNLIEEKESQGL